VIATGYYLPKMTPASPHSFRSMQAIAIKITDSVDAGFPPMVAGVLVDAYGQQHLFVEKHAVVTSTRITLSNLPTEGFIGCQVESEWIDAEGRSLIQATTTKPWGVESTAGTATFVVLASQLRAA